MDEDLQNAIDTVDAARQHKCELEGKLHQLKACLSQVTLTSERSRKEIEQHFSFLESKVISLIRQKQKELLDEVKQIETEAINPLEDCKVYLEEGIQESNSVIENEICDSIKNHGQISRQAPVQITELEPLPGGMIVSWDEVNAEETAEWIENGNTVLYKLQYCHGKATLLSSGPYSQSHSAFRDAYVGSNYSNRVKKLAPNTAYTFRLSRCFVKGDGKDKNDELEWSPWSVYQSGVTTLSGYEFNSAASTNGYTLQDKSRTAIKRSNDAQILHSTAGGYIIGYPITFRIDIEGKSHSYGDGFALLAKIDSTSSTIMKESSICVTADGKIFINGTESKTRFCNFCRNCTLRFNTCEIKSDEQGYEIGNKKSKSKYITLRVTITMMDKEAAFNWKIPSSAVTINAANRPCLGFAANFKSQGWKFSVI